MLDLDQLKSLYEAEPFRPFDIFLDDGRRVRVKERFRVGWSAERRTLGFDNNGVGDWVDFSRVKELQALRRGTSARHRRSGASNRKGRVK